MRAARRAGGRQLTVWLVGAGPGDPELLTVRAARVLARADVVVHDALVGSGVLELAPLGCELLDVGKRPGAPVPQSDINMTLIKLGRRHDTVVRLKGGDPYLFGRGGEEALALHNAGVDYDVIPGISAALAAPLAAGVPVTHRGVSASVTILTGHRRHGEPEPQWSALAALINQGGTLVVLMGVGQRAVIAGELIANGVASSTAVAVTMHATTARQGVARCRLDELAAMAIDTPAVITIGSVAAFDLRP
jgi:uroporphyrin-III C-methyltransferase